MFKPAWLAKSYQYIGEKEVSGPQSNDWIISLWQPIPWIWTTVVRRDDTLLPWCGAFIRYILVACDMKPPKQWYRASGFIEYGHKLTYPAVGCIGVLKNTKGQHHVGFVVGRAENGNIVMIGGNQDNQVKLSAFVPGAFIAFRWPGEDKSEIPGPYMLPTILDAHLSNSEV